MTGHGAGRLLLVANPAPEHVGRHLGDAARDLGLDVHLADTRDAFAGSAWRRRLAWRLWGHRPPRLQAFSAEVARRAGQLEARTVLTTGVAPVDAATLDRLGAQGVTRLNFLTDDPWNPAHHAPWFIAALARYDIVFTPRAANIEQLERLRGPAVVYLPFGYNPRVHQPAASPPDDEAEGGTDLLFAGGADPDRVTMVTPFIDAGFSVALFGGYWERYTSTAASARGMLAPDRLPQVVAAARTTLGLVRRANRDGHAMRTFEVAAMAGCMLLERTADHETLFGDDGDAVAFFDEPDDAIARLRQLLARPDERARMRRRAREVITGGKHTYADRLRRMLGDEAAGS